MKWVLFGKDFSYWYLKWRRPKNDEEKRGYTWYSADGIYFEGLEITPLEWLENIVELLKQTVQIY